MPEITYPLDTSGRAITNLISNELHTVSEANFRDYFFIVPNFAPFYINGFVLKFHLNGEERILTEGIDYSFALPYIAGTRSVGIPLYGAITLNNLDIAGILETTYQCLGGQWIANRLYVLQYLAEKAYNPRTTIWDVVTDKPEIFAPTPHYQDYATFYGQEELVAAIGRVGDAIAASRPELAFIEYITTHPPTADVIGLGNVANLPLATDEEVAARLPVDKYITLRQMLSLLESSYIQKVYSVVANKLDFYNTEDAFITFDTVGIPPGKTFYWRIEHITTTANDFVTDHGTIVSDADGRISFYIPFSSTYNKAEASTFRVQIRLGGVNGTLLVTTTNLSVRYGKEEALNDFITGTVITPATGEFITAAYLYSTVDIDLSSEQKRMPASPPGPSAPVLSLPEYIANSIIKPVPVNDITAAYLYSTVDVDNSSEQYRTPPVVPPVASAPVLSLHEYTANNIINPSPVNDITGAYLYSTIDVSHISDQYYTPPIVPPVVSPPVLSLQEYTANSIIKPVPIDDITAAYLYSTIDANDSSTQYYTPPVAPPVVSPPVLSLHEYAANAIINPSPVDNITAAYIYSSVDVNDSSEQYTNPPITPPIVPAPVLDLDQYLANSIINPTPVDDITAAYLYTSINKTNRNLVGYTPTPIPLTDTLSDYMLDVAVFRGYKLTSVSLYLDFNNSRRLIYTPPVIPTPPSTPSEGNIVDGMLNAYYFNSSTVSPYGLFLGYDEEL